MFAFAVSPLVPWRKPWCCMKRFSSIVLTVIFLAAGLSAQNSLPQVHRRDETLFGEAGLRLTGAWGGPTYGATFFDGGGGTFTRGGFGGVEFNRLLFIGVGSEWTDNVDEAETGQRFKFRRQGLLIGFIPLSQKVIHPKVNFWIGGGKVETDKVKDGIFVVQPGTGFEVNVFQWWKLGFEGGYRFVTRTDTTWPDNSDLSAFYLNFRLRFGYSWGE